MADFIIGDIIQQLDDIYSECMTYASDVERRQRCQRLLEAAILAESSSTVRAILTHPKISLCKYGSNCVSWNHDVVIGFVMLAWLSWAFSRSCCVLELVVLY